MSLHRALLISAATLLPSGWAHADLASDTAVLSAAHREAGAHVQVLSPRSLTAGSALPLALPASERGEAACRTLTVLGAVSTVFVLRVEAGDGTELVPSAGGAASLVRCGERRQELDAALVEMRSPHGILETVVSSSPAPLPAVQASLPHRDPGPKTPPEQSGEAPLPAPFEERARALEQAFRRDGAPEVNRKLVHAGPRGEGRGLLDLTPGCHFVAIIGAASPSDRVFHDLDAELSFVTGETADVDRSESPDATLLVCTGERRAGVLSFIGGPPDGTVIVLRGTAPLPEGIPEAFGPDGRGRIARALEERHVQAPSSPPAYASLGVQGVTILPVSVEPGRCYLVAIAPIRGSAQLLSLRFSVGSSTADTHTGDAIAGVALVSCARGHELATLEVLAHGPSLAWGLALWPLGRMPLGTEDE